MVDINCQVQKEVFRRSFLLSRTIGGRLEAHNWLTSSLLFRLRWPHDSPPAPNSLVNRRSSRCKDTPGKLIRHQTYRFGYTSSPSTHAWISHALTEICQRIGILQGRRAVWNILLKCVECHRLQGPCIRQTIAPLSSKRCSQSLAFKSVGIDFARPLFNRISNATKETKKVFICLITWAVTRAIHLELVQLLTTYCFILLFLRFVSKW